jgi:hypothetical protein
MKITVIVICLGLAIGLDLIAQDGHYWTQHYGTKSILLSNSAIGGVDDLGAVYYNPGRLSLIENPAFLLNVNVYELSRIKFEDAVGEGASKSKANFGSIPSFVAGTFKIKKLKGHHFAYSLLQRQNMDLDFSFRDETFGDVLEDFPGEEYFGANVQFDGRAKEEWYSLTWSYPIKSNLSVGITTSGTRYTANKGVLIELQALSASGKVAQYQFDRNYSLNHYALMWNLGVAGIAKKFKWGLTMKTPSIGVGGKGKYNYEEFFSGIEGVTENQDRFTTSRQNDLKVKYNRPLAIGGGVSIPINSSEIHLSGEWYNKVPLYSIMTAEPHISQSDGNTISFAVVEDLKSVFNYGIGTQVHFSEKLSAYGSVSTDFSAVKDERTRFSENEPEAGNSTFASNFYHFAGGVVMSSKRADITLGLSYTGAKQNFSRPVDFPEEGDDDIFEADETGTFKWNRLRIIFSFSFSFLKDAQNRFSGDDQSN